MRIPAFLRRLTAMVRVAFLEEFSSPVTLVFFLLLPLLFTFAVGTGLRGMMDPDEGTVEEIRIRLSVRLDDDGSLGEVLVDALDQGDLVPELVDALPEDGYGLVVPEDFTASLLNGQTPTLVLHTLASSSAPAVEQAVLAARGRVGGAVLVAGSGTEQAQESGVVAGDEASQALFVSVVEETLAATENPPAIAKVRWPEGVNVSPERDMATSAEQSSAGQLVTWVQITLLGAAEVIVAERLDGTLRRMLVAPGRRSTILLGKLIARLLMGLVQMSLLLGAGALLFEVGWGRRPGAVAMVSFAFALATVALGVLLATIVRTQGQASSLVVVMSMALAALGGAWFPLEVTPPVFRRAVQVLPSTWAMRAYTDILVRDAGVLDVLPQVGVLLAFAALFVTIGSRRFHRYA